MVQFGNVLETLELVFSGAEVSFLFVPFLLVLNRMQQITGHHSALERSNVVANIVLKFPKMIVQESKKNGFGMRIAISKPRRTPENAINVNAFSKFCNEMCFGWDSFLYKRLNFEALGVRICASFAIFMCLALSFCTLSDKK